MCALLSGDAGPVFTLVEDSAHVAMLSRYALRPGHAIVVPRQHATTFSELSSACWIDVSRVAHRVACAIERTLAPARCYVASLGTASDDVLISTPHLHLHVIPVDDPSLRPHQVLTWANGVYVGLDEDWADLRDRLRASMPPG
jgi:diadenosine tetraphosphate (Ap4A) HIT family hydrolase